MTAFFSYDGTSSATYAIKVAYGGVRNSVAAPVVDRLVQIPTRPGAWDYGATLGPRKIELDCEIYSPTDIGGTTYTFTQSDMMVLARAIEVWLDPRKGNRPLIAPDDASIWYAHYTGSSDFDLLLRLVKFKLPFICPDPFPH